MQAETRLLKQGLQAGAHGLLVEAARERVDVLVEPMQRGLLARHAQAKLPYISILTNPTTAGVMASYASLGDLIIAEPKCMIGFAGPRVIRETTHQELPKGFQTAEFLQDHGLIDMIVSRHRLRDVLSQLFGFLDRKK